MNKALGGIYNTDKLKTKLQNLFETTILIGPREFGLTDLPVQSHV
jgi:hypothetical protein